MWSPTEPRSMPMNREHVPDIHVLTLNFKPADTIGSRETTAVHEDISGSCKNISKSSEFLGLKTTVTLPGKCLLNFQGLYLHLKLNSDNTELICKKSYNFLEKLFHKNHQL